MDALRKVTSELDYAIGDRVETLMRRAGYNKTTLGREFSLSPSAMSMKLRGQRAWSASDVKRAADLLDVRVAVLYGDDPMPEPTLPARVTELKPRGVGPAGLEPTTSTVEWPGLRPVVALDQERLRRARPAAGVTGTLGVVSPIRKAN